MLAELREEIAENKAKAKAMRERKTGGVRKSVHAGRRKEAKRLAPA
jgi:hypothetical protein